MDQTTHDVRRANWLTVVTQCQGRTEGVSAKRWLSYNGVNEKSYYSITGSVNLVKKPMNKCSLLLRRNRLVLIFLLLSVEFLKKQYQPTLYH